MRLFAEAAGRSFRIIASAGSRLELPEQPTNRPFACLLWDHGTATPTEAQLAIARVLLDAGCRYVVCGGSDCEGWHEVIDYAVVLRHLDDDDGGLDAPLVMTTGHEGDSPAEVAYFFVTHTDFDDLEFRDYLLLHIGTGPDREPLEAALKEYALRPLGR